MIFNSEMISFRPTEFYSKQISSTMDAPKALAKGEIVMGKRMLPIVFTPTAGLWWTCIPQGFKAVVAV